MDPLQSLIQAIVVIVILFSLALVMRRSGVLTEEHSQIQARIVTDLFLPAIVFVTLAQRQVHWSQLGPALLMLGLELTAIALAWSASVLLRFDRPHQGAIVFCAAFGSSTFLGYSLITQMYPHDAEAMTEAVLISEIGVGYTIFILGPVLAAYFGSQELDARARWSEALGFFKSPVFFALLIGLLWGALQLPGEANTFLAPVFQAGRVLAAALTPVAILSIGLMFKVPRVRTILLPLGIVIFIKLILKPLAAGHVAFRIGFPAEWTDVLVILAAMPLAILGPIFLKRYGGDASIAPALLLAATIASGVTLAMVFSLVAGS